MIIPNVIIQLFSLYSNHDHELFNNLKKGFYVGDLDLVYSDIFTYQFPSFKIRLAVYTYNCEDEYDDFDGGWEVRLACDLEFVAGPQYKYDLEYSIHIVELYWAKSVYSNFDQGHRSASIATPFSIEDVQLQDLESLTIKLYIHKLVCYDYQEKVVCLEQAEIDQDNYQIMDLNIFKPSPYIFSWDVTNDVPILKITKFLPYETMTSHVFICNEIKWCIKLSRADLHFKHFNISIYALSIPSKISEICTHHKIFFRCKIN